MGALPRSLRLVPVRNRQYVCKMAWEPRPVGAAVTHVQWEPLEILRLFVSALPCPPDPARAGQPLLSQPEKSSWRKAGRFGVRLPWGGFGDVLRSKVTMALMALGCWF